MPATLRALLPKEGEPVPSDDEILSRFIGWVEGLGLELYPAQEEAILELVAGKHVVLSTPTGSGKSLVATALHFKAMCEGKISWYTCPIKALVNEKFFWLCDVFGPENVGLVTGDASVNQDAKIRCCTAEILSNLTLRDPALKADAVVMDEFHYYADRERGIAWQIPLLLLEKSTFLLMSATLGDVSAISEALQKLTNREVATVRSTSRPVPLEFKYSEKILHETIEDLVSQGKAPIYLVNFTQRSAAEQAQNLMSANFSSKEEKETIAKALEGFKFDTPFGKELHRYLRHGIGLHHAGLLPKYRLLVEKLAQQGMLKVVSGTDTLGVGVNIPLRTVLFTQLSKYDGEKTAVLSVRDFQQVSGRAGRKGFDTQGTVVAQAPEHVIENLKLSAKAAGGKKVVKRQPPKGFVNWDRPTFERLQSSQPEPLQSRFEVAHGLLLNLLQSDNNFGGGGYRRLTTLIARSHTRDAQKARHKRAAAQAFRRLRTAGLIELVKRGGHRGRRAQVSTELQRDFSLNHTLSLFLLDTLPKLAPESETHALDLLSLVESILENPMAVLYAQVDRAKGEKIAELKAQGMDYADRMNELDKVTYPKPNADFIYDTFNAFADKHPWVGAENIRPKSVAREIFETSATFNDYVRDYGLQRSEGVLLRYLSDAYKTLVQNVPEAARTEAVDDVIAFLRALVRGVDSSLVDEWERRMDAPTPTAILAPAAALPAEIKPPDLTKDPRALAARIRTELHRLLIYLSKKDYETAATFLWPAGGHTWTAAELETEMAGYWSGYSSIDTRPNARKPDKTILKEAGPRRWEALQKIVAPDGEEDFMLDCVVDLAEPRPDDAPLLELRRIGT